LHFWYYKWLTGTNPVIQNALAAVLPVAGPTRIPYRGPATLLYVGDMSNIPETSS
jgi:hypothetical protein